MKKHLKRREELLRTEGWHTTNIQLELYRRVDAYLAHSGKSREDLARASNMSLKRLKRILDGDFNGPLMQLVNISLAIGKVPLLTWVDLDSYVEEDADKERAAIATHQAQVAATKLHAHE